MLAWMQGCERGAILLECIHFERKGFLVVFKGIETESREEASPLVETEMQSAPELSEHDRSIGFLHSFQLGPLLLGVAVLVFVTLVSWANHDLLIGRHALFMDEWVSFDEVRSLLHPTTARSFLTEVIDGEDHRYGRLLFNLLATVSFLPERIWGTPGQIFACRTTVMLLQLGAFLLLVRYFLRSPSDQLLAFLCLCSLPHTVSFASLPKPEPLQLLALAFFLRSQASGLRFGASWFWLGIAFGVKISVLPVILLFVTWTLWIATKGFRERMENPLPFRTAIVTFFLGLVVGEPVILFGGLGKWISWTFLNTRHIYDDPGIGMLQWIYFVFFNWSAISPLLLLALAAGSLGLLWEQLPAKQTFASLLSCSNRNFQAFLLLSASFSLIFPILLRVQRLWGHYLHVGAILFIIGILRLAEDSHEERKRVPAALVTGTLCLSLFFTLPTTWKQVSNLATRTKQPQFLGKLAVYEKTVQTIATLSRLKPRQPTTLHHSAYLFPPSSSLNLEVKTFFWYFRDWDRRPDLIVLRDLSDEAAGHKGRKEFLQGLSAHVTDRQAKCPEDPCYLGIPLDDTADPLAKILLRRDLARQLFAPGDRPIGPSM
jgi:hypothetical protein